MTRVLVVDDDRDLADNLAEILNGDGHDATAVYSAHQAMLEAAREPYDVALIDMRMPDMNGLALVRRLLGESPRPIRRYIFMSAYADPHWMREAVAISERPVLEKPLEIRGVLRLVEGLC